MSVSIDSSKTGIGAVDSVAVVHAKLSEGKSGAQNAAELRAAHSDLNGVGGVIEIPGGIFQVDGDIDISNGRLEGGIDGAAVYGPQSILFRGKGIGGTRLAMSNSSGPLFVKSEGHGHGFRDLSLVGPGRSTDTVAVDWRNAAGGSLWENVWIENFGFGSRFIDATTMTFLNVHWHANGENVQLGFNCDLFQFIGGRIQNADSNGILIGYRDADHQSGAIQCSDVLFVGVRFGDNAVAFDVADYAASQIKWDGCYFENNGKIGYYGDAATQTGPHLFLQNCYFTRFESEQTYQIESRHANQAGSFEVTESRHDGTLTGTWLKAGTNTKVAWSKNVLAASVGQVEANGVTHMIPDQQQFCLNVPVMEYYDGAILGSQIPHEVRMTAGTDKTFLKMSRRSGSTGAELGIGSLRVLDIGGNFVAMDAPIRFATPSNVLPTASATYRGVSVYQQGGSGAADTIVCCMKDSAGAYSWKVVTTG